MAELGAQLADSVADVAAADVISVTVLNDEQVRDVVGELAAHAKPGTVIAIHSTIEPTPPRELADELEPKGIHVVDAPVSGGAGAAKKGEMAVMVGADDEAFELVKPVFAQWASLVVRAGEPGCGHPDEAGPQHADTSSASPPPARRRRLAEAAGIDLQDLGKVVRHSDAHQRRRRARSCTATTRSRLQPDHFLLRHVRAHPRAGREGPRAWRSRSARRTGVDLPLAEVALRDLAAGLGVPHTASTTKE